VARGRRKAGGRGTVVFGWTHTTPPATRYFCMHRFVAAAASFRRRHATQHHLPLPLYLLSPRSASSLPARHSYTLALPLWRHTYATPPRTRSTQQLAARHSSTPFCASLPPSLPPPIQHTCAPTFPAHMPTTCAHLLLRTPVATRSPFSLRVTICHHGREI